jgi:ribosomal protein S18 acetylase RimI-like enzyme
MPAPSTFGRDHAFRRNRAASPRKPPACRTLAAGLASAFPYRCWLLNGRLSQRGRKLASSLAPNSRSGLLQLVARLYEVHVPIRLRPVADDELASFVASTRDGYLISLVNDAGMGEEEAHEKTERDFAMLVREGRPVAGQQLFIVEETETSEPVGRVWLGERFPGEPIGFLYDIEIDGRFRGRGLGREAMLLVEQEARRRGFVEIRLNVFGGNETARSLYRSLQYVEFAIGMRKRLT